MNTCMEDPVSWLTLERYHLGELSPVENRLVKMHLDTCNACATCFQYIENDTRSLPALPNVAEESLWDQFFNRKMLFAAIGVGAMAAILFTVFTFVIYQKDGPEHTPAGINIKGTGEIVVTLQRERDGVVVEHPEGYLDGDVFQILVTSARAEETNWEVVIYQGGQVFFPYASHELLPTGNRVPLPGAFRLTGDEKTDVCLIVGDDIPSRDILIRTPIENLGERAVCTQLKPL